MYKILSTQPSKQSILVFRAHLRPARLLRKLLGPHDLLALYKSMMCSRQLIHETDIRLNKKHSVTHLIKNIILFVPKNTKTKG